MEVEVIIDHIILEPCPDQTHPKEIRSNIQYVYRYIWVENVLVRNILSCSFKIDSGLPSSNGAKKGGK